MNNYRLRTDLGIVGYLDLSYENVKFYAETTLKMNGFYTLSVTEKTLSYGNAGFISKLVYDYLNYYPKTNIGIYLETTEDAWTYVGDVETVRIAGLFKFFIQTTHQQLSKI